MSDLVIEMISWLLVTKLLVERVTVGPHSVPLILVVNQRVVCGSNHQSAGERFGATCIKASIA